MSQNVAEGQGSTETVTFLQMLLHIPEHIHESQLSRTGEILNIHPDNKNMTKKRNMTNSSRFISLIKNNIHCTALENSQI